MAGGDAGASMLEANPGALAVVVIFFLVSRDPQGWAGAPADGCRLAALAAGHSPSKALKYRARLTVCVMA